MTNLAFRIIAPAALIAIAGGAAFSSHGSVSINTTRQGPTVPPRFDVAYKFKVKGSNAKGSQKFHTSTGNAFLGDSGASFNGQFEARGDIRPTFFNVLFAPTGNGTAGASTSTYNFNSKKMTPEEAQLELDEFGFSLQRFDDDIGGTSNAEFAKTPVGVNGTFSVESLKVKGKVRERNGEYSGAFKYKAKGVITSGPNSGKTFKVSIKAKLRKAPLELS